MTNEEYIKSLNGIDLVKKMREIAFTPVYKYVDWEKWLKSEDKHYPIMGKEALHRTNRCYVQEEVQIYGEPYYIVVEGSLVLKVPQDEVRFS